MNNDDGFIYEETESLSEDDEKILKGIHNSEKVDPVTGRKQKKINILNKKNLSNHEMDEFFLDF